MKLLGVTSAVQLGMGLVGLRKALRDGTAYDLGFTRGTPETMKRDLWFMGTNLSAPAWMLLAQALATVLLMTRHRSRAAKALGILGVDAEPRVSGREVGSAGLAAPESVDNCADIGGGATGSIDGLARSAATAAIATKRSGPAAGYGTSASGIEIEHRTAIRLPGAPGRTR